MKFTTHVALILIGPMYNMASSLCCDSYFWSLLKMAVYYVDVKTQKVAATTPDAQSWQFLKRKF
jgi:hypothetical protein